jgi:hypothetical protein
MRGVFFLLVCFGLFTNGSAQMPFEFRELESCARKGNPYRYDGSLQSRKTDFGQVLVAAAPLTCASRVNVSVEDGTPIYINIEDVFVAGEPREICNCIRRFEITFKAPIPAGKTIWVLSNGKGIAHARAQLTFVSGHSWCGPLRIMRFGTLLMRGRQSA